MFAIMSMQTNLSRSNNFLEFQLKRTQLHGSILSQVLSDSDQCKCLFRGATEFPATGAAELRGYTPVTAIGTFDPLNCTAPLTNPLITAAGMDGLKLVSTGLRNLTPLPGGFSGDLLVNIESVKTVMGPKELPIKIPVNVLTVPGTPGNVVFDGCTTKSGGISAQLKIALSTMTAHERSVCLRNNAQNAVTISCPTGKALLTCSGGPGDIDEDHEGYWVLSDYDTQTCTLQIKRPRCVFGESWTYQRIIANCYQL